MCHIHIFDIVYIFKIRTQEHVGVCSGAFGTSFDLLLIDFSVEDELGLIFKV